MQTKDKYTLQELFDKLPITLVDLGKMSNINEVTLARIRDGEKARRDTVNRLMGAFSQVYNRDLSIDNVTGINYMRNLRLEKQAARKVAKEQAAEEEEQKPAA